MAVAAAARAFEDDRRARRGVLDVHARAAAAGDGGAPRWARLERVAGGHVLDLYMLALRCPVRRVEIGALSEGTLWMLPRVLDETRPEALALALFAREEILECVPRLLPGGAATERLKELELTVLCDGESGKADEPAVRGITVRACDLPVKVVPGSLTLLR